VIKDSRKAADAHREFSSADVGGSHLDTLLFNLHEPTSSSLKLDSRTETFLNKNRKGIDIIQGKTKASGSFDLKWMPDLSMDHSMGSWSNQINSYEYSYYPESMRSDVNSGYYLPESSQDEIQDYPSNYSLENQITEEIDDGCPVIKVPRLLYNGREGFMTLPKRQWKKQCPNLVDSRKSLYFYII
jgi:hypothetical protein